MQLQVFPSTAGRRKELTKRINEKHSVKAWEYISKFRLDNGIQVALN